MTRRIIGWMGGGALLVALASAPGCGGGSCGMVGTWQATSSNGLTYTVTFVADGTYTTLVDGQPGVSGGWALSGSTFTFIDGAQSGCPTGSATYTVTFAASCDTLTLSNPADSCKERSSALTGVTFTRQ